MDLLIDGISFKDYGIIILDHTPILGIAQERVNEREWADKSGVDKNLVNIRYDTREFQLSCIIKAIDEIEAYDKAKILVDYMFTKGCFVISIKDRNRAWLCQRSKVISPDINIREQNSLYYFKLALTDVNPNALVFYPTSVLNEVTINYTKGKNAVIYWGDGQINEVSNSGNYTNSSYAFDGKTSVIIDTDKTDLDINILNADFIANLTTVYRNQQIQFTNQSTGDIAIYSWNFGDGETSGLENPTHTYNTLGLKTVTLQVFNTVQGSSFETKTDYINVVHSPLLINNTDALLINDIDALLID